jgi:hypothetical protein
LILLNSEGNPMSAEHPQENAEPRVTIKLAVSDDSRPESSAPQPPARASSGAAAAQAQRSGDSASPSDPANKSPQAGKSQSPASQVSKAKLEMQSRLPALADDADIGVQKEQVVTRDGKADLRFIGVLLASEAPGTVPEGRWQELRIYETDGGRHVFSRITRNVLEKEKDSHEAEIYDPAPSSVPSHLVRSAREMVRGRPFTWMDAAVAFFGYDPLAKALYRKLSVKFEEQIS